MDDAQQAGQASTPGEQQSAPWPLEGFFACGSGLLVTPECLGQSFQIRTPRGEFTLTFPELDAPDAGSPLRRPAWRFNRLDETPGPSVDARWGELEHVQTRNPDGTWPAYNALVRRCALSATVTPQSQWTVEVQAEPGGVEEFREVAELFGGELAAWWELVTDWLGVLTHHDFVRLGAQRRSFLPDPDGFYVWSGDAAGVRRAATSSRASRTYMVPARRQPLDRDVLQRSFDLAANGYRPPLEWLLIRDARSLSRGRDYRRAVIDAGAATELALTELLDRRLEGVDPVIKDTLMRRSTGLDRRAELTRKLGAGTVPNTFADNLKLHRNNATHREDQITEEQAHDALDVAADIVEQAYPLASFTP